MPNAAAFLKGFGFIQGTEIAGYVLSNTRSTHEQIIRYREYAYQITLVFQKKGAGRYEDLFMDIDRKISQEHTIYSDYGNPYRCIIDPIQHGDVTEDDAGTITFNLKGHSYRVYNK